MCVRERAFVFGAERVKGTKEVVTVVSDDGERERGEEECNHVRSQGICRPKIPLVPRLRWRTIRNEATVGPDWIISAAAIVLR